MSVLGVRTIVVATDASDALIPAVQTAARLAELNGARLHIVHTTETPVPESRFAEHLRLANITPAPDIEQRVLVGPPGALIVQDALRVNADARGSSVRRRQAAFCASPARTARISSSWELVARTRRRTHSAAYRSLS